jgi:nucleoside-diphosphate-sugar epimerase
MGGRLFVFGLGYTATRLAQVLLADGWSVAGTTRTPEKAAALNREGVAAVVPSNGDAPTGLLEATHVLASAPPSENGDPCLPFFQNSVEDMEALHWVGYLSTTGVYGNLDGGEATEATALNPSSPRSQRRVDAEQAWCAGFARTDVFRLSGIYGPDRNALQQIVDGRARRISKPGHRFSRVHVDDIVQAVYVAMTSSLAGCAYNICDDLPAESADVLGFAAELLRRPPPPLIPFDEATLTPMARSFYQDNKTVSNQRMKQALGARLQYPTYREGLTALLADYSPG